MDSAGLELSAGSSDAEGVGAAVVGFTGRAFSYFESSLSNDIGARQTLEPEALVTVPNRRTRCGVPRIRTREYGNGNDDSS